jgi:hypothetical protein
VASAAARVGHLPPVSILFAAFLGYNPIQSLLGPHVVASLSAASRATLTGGSFFPHLISVPFKAGLDTAFTFAIIACLIAGAASLLRGGTYHYTKADQDAMVPPGGEGVQLNGSATGVSAGAGTVTQIPTREEQHAG